MQYTTDGLVIKEVNVSENDKMLTLLTPEKGRISVMAKGSRSIKSKTMGISQIYTYGNYEIYEKNDLKWLKGGSVIDGFYGIRNDIEKLSLATYLSDVAIDLTGEDDSSVEMLRMILNAFYALSRNIKPNAIIKGVYELRSAGFSGFMPDVTACRHCKKDDFEVIYLDVMNGKLICSECLQKRSKNVRSIDNLQDDYEERNVLLPMSKSVLAAVRYSLYSNIERMFSFNLDGEDEIAMFAKVAEEYLLHHLERGFASLDFYKNVSNI